LLSVVIPARNAEGWLSEQLEALADQEVDQGWEVILADNGSSDGTVAVFDSFSPRSPGPVWSTHPSYEDKLTPGTSGPNRLEGTYLYSSTRTTSWNLAIWRQWLLAWRKVLLSPLD